MKTKAASPAQGNKKGRGSRFVSDAVPLYYQLAGLLREKIIAGRYAPGEQIPTEANMVREYGLSRITVRQALHSLEREKLIQREPGRGTFVTERQPFAGKLALDGSIQDLISMGVATSVKLLEIVDVSANPEDAVVLGLKPGDPVTRITRVRYYHQEPYSYIINQLPAETGHRISRNYLKRGSMLKFIEEELGIRLRDANQTVRATLADAELARWLRIRIGAPLISVDRVVRSQDIRPVMRTHTYYRSDIFSFTIHLTRDPAGDNAPHAGWVLKGRKGD